MTDLRDALLTPKGVALIGASADPNKNTGRPQRYLRKHGFAGRVFPVNPGRQEVQGEPAFASLNDIDGPCEQAFIMVPTDHVIDAVTACGENGIKLATIYSDGFAEQGEAGRARQDALLNAAAQAGVRILGPNSMGVICPENSLTLSVNAVLEMPALKPGRFGLISQSGTILGTLLSRGGARGIGFSRMLSVGNEADIGVAELIDVLTEDPETDAILLFLEAIRDAPRLADAARRAFDAGKPVIAYKLGKSQAGQAVALSHSGALAGEDKAVDAFLRSTGIVRIETLEAMFEMPPLLIGRRPVEGSRVAVVTTTGGGASTVVDRLGAFGLDLVPAPERVHHRLAESGLRIGKGPLIDLTMAGTRDGIYGAALEELLGSGACDAVVCVVGSSAQFHPGLAVQPIIDKGANANIPVAAFMVPEADESLDLLAAAGIAAFRTPEACADAVRALLAWRAPAPSMRSEPLDVQVQRGNHILDEAQSLALFSDLGIPVPGFEVVGPGDAAQDLSYPVVVKALSSDLPHKTEAGAVRLGVDDADAVVDAIEDIRANVERLCPAVTVDRFLVEEMAAGVGEVLIGFRIDPQVGPVVVLAPGGVLAEVYGDSAIRPAPIDIETAEEMIAEVKGLAPLRGYRNLPKGDLEALAQALTNLSNLARLEDPPLEAEINPMIVRAPGEGVVAVDGLVVFSS